MQIHPAVMLNGGTLICNAQDAVTTIIFDDIEEKNLFFFVLGNFRI